MNSPEFRSAVDEFAAFHFRGGTRGKQGRSPLRRLLQPFDDQITGYLESQFDGVCAYTEVAANEDTILELAWHRPPSNASGLDGSTYSEHYWWLALDFRNWYQASEQVASIKGNGFPVLGERMHPPELTEATMPNRRGRLDDGLILDPCEDSPSFWLRFDEDGSVSSRPHIIGERRGVHTISALDLGSERLNQSRRQALGVVRERAAALHEPFALVEALAETAGPGTPHRGAIIQALIRRRVTALPRLSAAEIETVLHDHCDEFLNEFAEAGIELESHDTDARRLITNAAEQAFDSIPNGAFGEPFQRLLAEVTSVPAPPALVDEAPPAATSDAASRHRRKINAKTTISPTNRISRIEIKNFRAIVHLVLDLQTKSIDLLDILDLDDDERAEIVTLSGRRWKMLLGENGSGKSSILHAIALALAGAELDSALERADLTWDDLLRWGDSDGDRPDGRVLIDFTGDQRIDLRFDAVGHKFWGLGKDAPAINTNVRGYGAARFPATDRSGTSSDDLLDRLLNNQGETSCNIDNLLDSTVPILNAKAWLGALDDAAFNVAAETISDLLGESSLVRSAGAHGDAASASGQRITRAPIDPAQPDEPRKVLVDGEPLSLVSDGYKSVIALGCEIMAGVGGLTSQSGGTSDLREAVGIVLIDEIGAHLHPRWRMQITGKLRKAFPKVQFFVTTHEPLCLRGLVEREVIRVTKYETHGVLLDEIDRAPGRYRVDQLLTSEFFGLNSAIDPKVDRLFAEYYELKRKARLSSAQLERLEQLENQINDKALRPILGYTRRDQLIFEAIDEFLLDDPLDAALPEDRKARRNEIVRRVAGIWKQFSDTAAP